MHRKIERTAAKAFLLAVAIGPPVWILWDWLTRNGSDIISRTMGVLG